MVINMSYSFRNIFQLFQDKMNWNGNYIIDGFFIQQISRIFDNEMQIIW